MQLLEQVRLVGSWDADGRYSDNWTETAMEEVVLHDGCPAFAAKVGFRYGEQGKRFYWGVRADIGDRKDVWCIKNEVASQYSKEQVRTFVLDQEVPGEQYFLNDTKHLGARKYYYPGQEHPGIRFAVWAPNASKVEVVMADLWEISDGTKKSIINPDDTPAVRPALHHQIAGGYVGDDGSGILQHWGPFQMKRTSEGIWYTDTEDEALRDFAKFVHAPYMYRITTRGGAQLYRTDLYSMHQIGSGAHRPQDGYTGRIVDLAGTVSCSIVIDPDTVTSQFDDKLWPPQKWIGADRFWGYPGLRAGAVKRMEDLVIYELHVGALGFGKPDDEPGTLGDAIQFLDYIEDLGVTAVELLPMSEYAGNAGEWGYSTSHYFAIEYSGGGREKYKWFIRECHDRGIAVIIDVLYNHFIHDAERSEWMYDTSRHEENPYYWYEGHPEDYPEFNQSSKEEHYGTGGYLDNLSTGWAPCYHRERIRKMFISSAIALVTDFHVDGFRVDQTSSIHAYNVLHATGERVEEANRFGKKLLRELTDTLRMIKPEIILIAEDHTNWSGVTEKTEQDGLGFDLSWYSDFYHHLIGDTDKGDDYARLIHTAGTGYDGPLAMDYFAGVLCRSGDRKVVYHKSHDEAGNGKYTDRNINTAANGPPDDRETRCFAEARCRFAAGITLLSAGTPMFLFGEEVLAKKKFMYGKVLEHREDFEGARKNRGSDHFEYYRQLIHFRLDHDAMKSRNIAVLQADNENRVIVFSRWSGGEYFLVLGTLNNQPIEENHYSISHPDIGEYAWKEVFNSDATEFGGHGLLNKEIIRSRRSSLMCILPCNAVVVLRRV